MAVSLAPESLLSSVYEEGKLTDAGGLRSGGVLTSKLLRAAR